MTFPILQKTVSSHLFLSPTVCESHCIFNVKGSLWHLFLWQIGSKWHWTFCERQSHHIFSYHQQFVSHIAFSTWKEVLWHLFLWPIGSKCHTAHFVKEIQLIRPFLSPTVCEWHCTFCERQSHHICSYHQQGVSWHVTHFVKGSFITSFLI